MRLHGRGSCGWTPCISLLACLCYYQVEGFLSTCISGPLICRIPMQLCTMISWPQTKGHLEPLHSLLLLPIVRLILDNGHARLPEKWRKILLDIPLNTTLPIPWTGIIFDGTRWIKEQGKQVNYYDLSTREQIQRSSPEKCIKKEPRQEDGWLSQKA